jgi:DNA-binding NtrC family response regulator
MSHLPGELAADPEPGQKPIIPGATMAELERHAILTTLEACGGSTSKAADMLGISVRKIQYKLQEYGAAPKSHVPAIHARAANGK